MPSSPASGSRSGFGRTGLLLYAAVVFFWGTSWIGLHFQLGVVAPEVSLFWRFLIATSVMAAWTALRHVPMRYGAGDMLRFAGMGATIFSTNFLLMYYGGMATPSGLLAVVFSLTSVFNMLLAALVFGQRPRPRELVAALLGFGGVALMFLPQLTGTALGSAAAGLMLCVAGTLSFCIGNMITVSSQRRGVPIAASTTWGMAWGALFLLLVALVRGQPFIIETTPGYLGSLLWLAIGASVLAFAAYMSLLQRVGPGRAGFSTVLYPVVALAISTVVEDYRWSVPAIAGLILVLAANVLMLTGRRDG